MALAAGVFEGLVNHAARHRIDGPVTDGTGKAGLGHSADALAADDFKA